MGQRRRGAKLAKEGRLADRASELILAGLGRAAADPAGTPLHGSRSRAGLFASTAAGRIAAQRCKEAGYLHTLRTEKRGRAAREICAITDKGLAHLFGRTSPHRILEDFLRALEARQQQAAELIALARQMQTTLEALRSTAERMLHQAPQPTMIGPELSNGVSVAEGDLLHFLQRWLGNGGAEDCPLPDLYRQAGKRTTRLTIGQFHDALRALHEKQQIYLHPWTGPLYAVPEPAYALLVGHEVAYYASRRSG
jgi:hypothetical protein